MPREWAGAVAMLPLAALAPPLHALAPPLAVLSRPLQRRAPALPAARLELFATPLHPLALALDQLAPALHPLADPTVLVASRLALFRSAEQCPGAGLSGAMLRRQDRGTHERHRHHQARHARDPTHRASLRRSPR
jgi:hypothetical protein